MDEHFAGYLLGALDPVTQARVEAHVKAHPAARERLDLMRAALAPLAEDATEPEPPPGLALLALARIAEHQCMLPPAPAPLASQVESPPWRPFRRVDWIAAACLLFTVGGFGLPYLVGLWQDQQRTACANNLRQAWVALTSFSDQQDGQFPRVESHGPRAVAGVFVPLLREHGIGHDLNVSCPGQPRVEPVHFSMADLEQLYRDTPDEYQRVSQLLAGHYAYTLGYLDQSTLRGLRRDSSDGLPILADRSDGHGGNSPNHNGRGQNVLYVGGNVRWAVHATVGESADHIYINQRNQVGAGLCRIDTVLGSSAARPGNGEQ
ncbi:MAG: hypothetical protein U0840_18925 [Gemmataceae bacterium]